ncbi:hypothetical protein [Pseudomonas lopnurensis]|uniref:hypothetical protein n=1 Tax=Pseudomonas lopnurensis TaxID=1477517 RepID=UPI0028ADF610|nr:hypothetical protein [Pseudomonas lopnurensis]
MSIKIKPFNFAWIYKGNIASIVWFMLKSMPCSLLSAVILKLAFISLQAISVWLVFMWFFGNVSAVIERLIPYVPSSYLYPVLSSAMFVSAALLSLASKKITLTAIKKILDELDCREDTSLTVGEYRGLAKFFVSAIDSFVPIVFIITVLMIWIFYYPITMPFFMVFIFIALFLLRYAIGRSVSVIRGGSAETKASRIDTFFKILILPQYVIFAIYCFVALCILLVSVLFKEYGLVKSKIDFLFILSIFAAMQFKSSVGLIIRMGAYYGAMKKALVYINRKI